VSEPWGHTQRELLLSAGAGPDLLELQGRLQSHLVAQTGWGSFRVLNHSGVAQATEMKGYTSDGTGSSYKYMTKVRLNKTSHFILAALQGKGPWLGVRHSWIPALLHGPSGTLFPFPSRMGLISQVLMVK